MLALNRELKSKSHETSKVTTVNSNFAMAAAACTTPGGEGTATATLAAPTPTAEKAETPSEENNLANTNWTLQSFGPVGETPVIGETALTLLFESEGQVSGNGGCNSFSGSYEVEGNQLVFNDIVSTLRACADENLTAQEQQYVGALQTAGEFEQTTDQLTTHSLQR
jgi:putative lipoprotein